MIEGMAEYLAILRNLPAELAEEAGAIVVSTAEDAKKDAFDLYPEPSAESRKKGVKSLREGLAVQTTRAGRYGAGARLVNRSPHAWLYENGTAARQTALGYNRGAMPATAVFIPAAIRRRRAMYEQLAAMVRGYGLEVSANAGAGFL
jgi:hypothetical protein